MRALCGQAQWDVRADKKESGGNPLFPQPVSHDYFRPATPPSHGLLLGLLILGVAPQKAFI